MADSDCSRRVALQALASAALAPGVALAQPQDHAADWTERPAFATGPLAGAPLAGNFKAPAGELSWPDAVPLLGRGGPRPLSQWRGKTLLVTLWAEWCAPCLAEMPALSRLNRAYGNRGFEILPILTGSKTVHSYAEARDRLARLKGADIDTLADGSRDGQALMFTLAATAPQPLPPGMHLPPGAFQRATSLPCLLIVDPAGRLRGRALGMPTDKRTGGTVWETPAGDAFIKRLADGAVSAEAHSG